MALRDKQGRFVKGHSGNPNGRPRRATEEKVLRWLTDCISKEDVQGWMQAANRKASRGDASMLRLLLSYLIGMPTQYVQQDTQGTIDVQVTWADDNGNGECDVAEDA